MQNKTGEKQQKYQMHINTQVISRVPQQDGITEDARWSAQVLSVSVCPCKKKKVVLLFEEFKLYNLHWSESEKKPNKKPNRFPSKRAVNICGNKSDTYSQPRYRLWYTDVSSEITSSSIRTPKPSITLPALIKVTEENADIKNQYQ